jgi:hypothetical protein
MPKLHSRNKRSNNHFFICPNPNCRDTFSEPKIIEYRVCPVCQSLIDMPEVKNLPTTPKALKKMKRRRGHGDTAVIQHVECTSQSEDILPESHKEVINLDSTTEEILTSVETATPALSEEELPNILDSTSSSLLTMDQSDASSSNPCCHQYFGYLGQRKRGENIPSICISCARSIDCMLSEYHKSEQAVSEIKKWYKP